MKESAPIPTLTNEAIALFYKMPVGVEQIYDITTETRNDMREGDPAAQTEVREQTHVLTVMQVVQKAVALGADGSCKVEVSPELKKLVKDGREIALSPEQKESARQKVYMRMARNGEILESSVATGANLIPQGLCFPAKPLFLGDSWEDAKNLKIEGLQVLMKHRYTLTSIVRLNGRSCARIMANLPEMNIDLGSGAAQRIASEGQTLFAFEEGLVVRSDIETNSLVTADKARVESKIRTVIALAGLVAPS